MTNRQLNLATAQRLVTAVVDAATTQGIAVAVTVIDRGGHPLASARMDGLAYPFLEVSRRKAVTGSSFGSPTHVLSRYFAQDPSLRVARKHSPNSFFFQVAFLCFSTLSVWEA